MPDPSDPRVTVVGIGADGWAGLAESARTRVAAAAVVVGGARHLASLPVVDGQQRVAWPSPFDVDVVPDGAVVLASGDPLVSGVATTLVDRWGADAVEVVPHVSSVALARAHLGWPGARCAVVSTTSGSAGRVLRELAPGRRVLVLSAGPRTPDDVAALLVAAGYGASTMTVLADLGSAEQAVWSSSADAWPGGAPALHVLALDLVGPPVGSWSAGLPDDAFEHDGQLTKRDLRASALARLAPRPGELLWDIGAGAGSVGIEWMRAHPTCRTWALEREADRVARIGRNAARLGVPDLRVVEGAAPDGLAAFPEPDAIFVGGGATAPGLLDLCRERLRPGGRLVVHGVTLETEQLLVTAYAEHGGELTRLAVETAEPIGTFTGWRPARAVTQWSWEKP